MAVVSQTPALKPAKNPWFYSDNMFMLQSALGLRHFSSYQKKPEHLWVISFSPASRTIFFITMMLQTVLTAFYRCLCQCKSFFFAGTIPYSDLKSCREILTSMSKIGVTCLLTLGQLEFIQKWIRNTLMKKREKGGLKERRKSKFYFISYGWKKITSIYDNTLCWDFRHTFSCVFLY